MTNEQFKAKDKNCISFIDKSPEYIIIQPADNSFSSFLQNENDLIASMTSKKYIFTTFFVSDWNKELSPWEAPSVFGKSAFGSGADKTLDFILNDLIPELIKKYDTDENIPVILGGYSLAGLFTLWSVYQTDRFSHAAAVSPSVWFPDWINYASSHDPVTRHIYMSLGDKEEKTKNALMKTVGNCLKKQYELLENFKTDIFMEMNEGNHFKDPDMRCAKGFAWCLNQST